MPQYRYDYNDSRDFCFMLQCKYAGKYLVLYSSYCVRTSTNHLFGNVFGTSNLSFNCIELPVNYFSQVIVFLYTYINV